MNEKDTQLLLRECSAGIRMAIASIDDVLPYLEDSEIKQVLKESKTEHKDLEKDIDNTLHKMNCDGKEPNIMAKGMSKIKTNAEMAFKPTAAQAASLITDGCGMGIKSIHKYINQYPAASSEVMHLAQRISELEDNLEQKMKPFL
ncbi:MAG: hypothetical protein E7547_09035 [Ruminococcaceae bacterium]|nr:hypothetical protein [Oscillospiraceae bacterium]